MYQVEYLLMISNERILGHKLSDLICSLNVSVISLLKARYDETAFNLIKHLDDLIITIVYAYVTGCHVIYQFMNA